MGEHTCRVSDAPLIAASRVVQGQCDGLCAALRRTGETGNLAVRHRNSVQNGIIAALKIRTKHGVNIAVQTIIRAGLDVRVVPAVGNDLPDQHLRGGILHLTAVTVIHLRVAECQNLLNVAALKVIQFQLPIGGTASFIGGVGGVILSAQRRSVG